MFGLGPSGLAVCAYHFGHLPVLYHPLLPPPPHLPVVGGEFAFRGGGCEGGCFGGCYGDGDVGGERGLSFLC